MLAPVSGGHFNPIVSAVSALPGTLDKRDCAVYVLAQVLGAVCGVVLAHAMFGLPLLEVSRHARPTAGEGLGEIVATFGLIMVILLTAKHRPQAIPFAVAAFITSAYWFTSSTSFANPAVTLARALTDTFAGISADSVPLFLGGQLVGALAATAVARWLLTSA